MTIRSRRARTDLTLEARSMFALRQKACGLNASVGWLGNGPIKARQSSPCSVARECEPLAAFR